MKALFGNRKYDKVIKKIRNGDSDGFASFYSMCIDKFTRWIKYKFWEKEDFIAQFAVEEALIEISKQIEQGEVTYIYDSFIKKFCQNKYHQEKRKHPLIQEILKEHFSDWNYQLFYNSLPEDNKAYKKVERVLEEMGEPCRTWIVFKHMYNYSHEELVELEESDVSSTGSSRVRLKKCMSKFKTFWEQMYSHERRD